MFGFYIGLTTILATTYGYGEKMCGEGTKNSPVMTCESGRLTASGIPFDILEPTVAVYTTPKRRIRGNVYMCIRHLKDNSKVWLRVTDKHYKEGRVDLSPMAVASIGGKVSAYWSHKIKPCGWKKEGDKTMKTDGLTDNRVKELMAQYNVNENLKKLVLGLEKEIESLTLDKNHGSPEDFSSQQKG